MTSAVLGDIASIGPFAIVNLDPTNYVEVKVATAGAIFARLAPDVDADGKPLLDIQPVKKIDKPKAEPATA